MSPCVVIDANRIFSELIAANHQLRRALTSLPKTRFICPKYVFVEIFTHKERIADASGLSEPELLSLLHSILERIEFIDEDSIRLGSWTEAWCLCRDVDENDNAYVALLLLKMRNSGREIACSRQIYENEPLVQLPHRK